MTGHPAAVRIPGTGLYSIAIEPTVVGGIGLAYDLDGSARWAAPALTRAPRRAIGSLPGSAFSVTSWTAATS